LTFAPFILFPRGVLNFSSPSHPLIMEVQFLHGLISRLLHSIEKTGNKNEMAILMSTLIQISDNRVHLVITELEKVLSKKSSDFQKIRAGVGSTGTENYQEQLIFAEELLLLMNLISASLRISCSRTFLPTSSTSSSVLEASASSSPASPHLSTLIKRDRDREDLNKDSHNLLHKNLCNILMSTVGAVIFFQSQFLDIEISSRLSYACGAILSLLSEINQEGANFHIHQLLKQCLEPQAEQRGNFYTLKSLQYLRLKSDGMMLLCSHLADVIDAPTSSGKWKKNAMLEITTPLRLCIFQWLETDASAMRLIYTSAIDCPDHPSLVALLMKLEPWASGAKKRSSVWPLILILLALTPKAFQSALEQLRMTSPPVPTARLSLEGKLLKKTLESLKPSAMQNILQKDSALFTELSFISLVSMMKVTAILKRYLSFGTTGNMDTSGVSAGGSVGGGVGGGGGGIFHSIQRNPSFNHSGGSGSFSASPSARTPSVVINQNMETSFNNLWAFISPCLDKLITMVFQGIYPTPLYYNAIATSPTSVFVPSPLSSTVSDSSSSSSTQGMTPNPTTSTTNMTLSSTYSVGPVQEFTSESLFDLFMWSLFYIDQVKYFQLMIKIHSPEVGGSSGGGGGSNHLPNTFVRPQSIRALSSILMTDSVDRIGKTPTWRLTLASEVRSVVLANLTLYRNRYLEETSSIDPERSFLLSINSYQTMHWEEMRESESSSSITSSAIIDHETIIELLRLIIANPWFVFIRKSIDEQSENSILQTMFTVHLTVLLRDLISFICLTPYSFSFPSSLPSSSSAQYQLDLISRLAEVAFSSLVQSRFISLWTPKDPFQGALNINAIVLKYLSYELLCCGSEMKVKTMRLLRSMHQLLGNLNEYIGEEDLLRGLSSSTEVIYNLIHIAMSTAEAAILIHLCNSDTEIISLSASCLSLLCIHHEYISCIDCKDTSSTSPSQLPVPGSSSDSSSLVDQMTTPILFIKPTRNIWPIYREMASTIGNILSVKLQQKNTRSYLSNMPCRTQGMNWALYCVMNRWISFNKLIHTTAIPSSSSTVMNNTASLLSQNTAFDEWSNYTGFLCALGDGLSSLYSPCTSDYLIPLLTMATIPPPTLDSPNSSYSTKPSKVITSAATGAVGSLGGVSVESPESKILHSTTTLIRSLLHLMLLQHPEKRVSLDVFVATGMFLTPSLIFLLFQELCVIQDLILDLLCKKKDFSTPHIPSSSSSSSRSLMVDFDTFISDMSLIHIYGFVQAMLTMLQFVFDREWYKATSAGTSNDLLKDMKDTGSVVEKVVYRSALIVVKLLKQLQGYDTQAPDSSSSSSSRIMGHTNPSTHPLITATTDSQYVRVSLGEKFRLKKKTSDVIETFLKNKSGILTSPQFHMKLLSILMEWTFDCTSSIEMLSGGGMTDPSHGSKSNSPMTIPTMKKSSRSVPTLQGKLSALRLRPSELDRDRTSTISECPPAISSASATSPTSPPGNVLTQEEYSLYRSTEIAFAKAICYLLDGVELTTEGTEEDLIALSPPNAQIGGGKVSSKSSTDVEKRSKLFNKYFHVLQYLLISSLHHFDQQSSQTMILREKNELFNVTIQALCNLLSSNSGIGLKHMIEAASTHENQVIRGAYLRVFTEVISKTTDISFANDDDKLPSYEELLAELRTLLLAPDRELAKLICSSARGKEAEEIGKNILLILDEQHPNTVSSSPSSSQLLDWIIEYEVTNTPRIGTLFRSETMGTKLIGSFFALKGRHYLTQVLFEPMQQYLFSSSSLNLEVDPNKGVDHSQIEINMMNLRVQATIFVNSIINSVIHCPRELKHILEILRLSTSRKFSHVDGCDRIAVSGYIFLRFFCPAIAMPDKYQLSTHPPNRQQLRGLLLIAKTLQNLANGTYFAEGECMEALNSWIDSFAGAISFFSYEISSVSSCSLVTLPVVDSDDEEEEEEEGEGERDVSLPLPTGGRELKENGDTADDEAEGMSETGSNKDDEEADSGSSQVPMKPPQQVPDSNHLTEKEISAMIAIHRYLSTNQERFERLLPVSESDQPSLLHFRERLFTLLQKLGEPLEELVQAEPNLDSTNNQTKLDQNLSEVDVFLRDVEKRRTKAAIEFVREMRIFYQAPPPPSSSSPQTPSSSSTSTTTSALRDALGGGSSVSHILTTTQLFNHSFFFFICRRVTSETDAIILIYLIVCEIMSVVRLGGTFDLIIDSSSFNTDAELPMWGYSKFWGKLKPLLGSICEKHLKRIYILYPSIVVVMSARKVLKKWGLKTRTVVDKVEVTTPLKLCHRYPHLTEKMPVSTLNIETSGSSKKWQALFHDREVTLLISGALLIVQTNDKFGGLEYKRSDILSLLLIDNISAGYLDTRSAPGKRFGSQAEVLKRKFIRNSNRTGEEFDQHIIITYTASQSTRSLKLQVNQNENFLSTLSSALTQVRQQRALEHASTSSGIRITNRHSIPGMMLHVALLNLFSISSVTRKTAFLLLCQLKETYHLPLSLPLPTSQQYEVSLTLFVPSNMKDISVTVSGEIALSNPEFGKEFLNESFQALRRNGTTTQQKVAIIMYISPWLPLLEQFCQHCDENLTKVTSHSSVGTEESEIQTPIQPERKRPSFGVTTPLKTPPRRASTNSASFLSTLNNSVPSTPLVPSTPFPVSLASPDKGGSDLSLDIFGGRVLEHTFEEITKEIEEMCEISIILGSEDPALANLLAVELWDVIAPMSSLSTIAMKHILRRLREEARSRCTMNKTSKGRDLKGLREARSPLVQSKQGFSYLGQSSHSFFVDTSRGDNGKTTTTMSDSHTDCRYCLTMCEISALLAAQSPITVSDLLISEIMSLMEKLSEKKSSKSSSIAVSPTRGPPLPTPRGESTDSGIIEPSDDQDATTEVPKEVLDGVALFFALQSDSRSNKLSSRRTEPPSHDLESGQKSDLKDSDIPHRPKRMPPRGTNKVLPENLLENLYDESDIWIEVIALLRPLNYQIFQNSILLQHCLPKIVHLVVTIISYGHTIVLPHVHTLITTMVYAMTLFGRILLSPSSDQLPLHHFYPPLNMTQTREQIDLIQMTTIRRWDDILSELNNETFHLIFNKAPCLTANHFEKIIRTLSLIFTDENINSHITDMRSGGTVSEISSLPLIPFWRKSLWDLSLASALKSLHSSNYTTFFLLLGNLIDDQTLLLDHNIPFLRILLKCLMRVIEAYCHHISSNLRTQDTHTIDETTQDTYGSTFIFNCLGKAVPFLGEETVMQLFWVNILVLLYFPLKLLAGSITFMHSIIRHLLNRNPIPNLEDLLMTSRDRSKVLSQLFRRLESDNTIGVSFRSCFSVAFTSILMRALVSPDDPVAKETSDILKLLFENYQMHITPPNQSIGDSERREQGLSGYAMALCVMWGSVSSVAQQPVVAPSTVVPSPAPASPRPVSLPPFSSSAPLPVSDTPILISIHPNDPIYRPGPNRKRGESFAALLPSTTDNKSISFFGEHHFPTNRSAILFVTTLLAHLKLSTSETEQLFILSLLLQIIKELPSILFLSYDLLFPQLVAHYNFYLDRESSNLTSAIFDLLNECLKRNGNKEMFQAMSSLSSASSSSVLHPTMSDAGGPRSSSSSVSALFGSRKKKEASTASEYLSEIHFPGLLIGPHLYSLGIRTSEPERCSCTVASSSRSKQPQRPSETVTAPDQYITPEFSLSSSLSSLIGDDDLYKMSKIVQANAENLCPLCLARHEANNTVSLN
jgi:hypothetical protein